MNPISNDYPKGQSGNWQCHFLTLLWILYIFTGFGDEGRSFSFAFKTFVDDLDSQFSMFFTSSTPFEFSAFYGNKEDPFAQFFSSKYIILMISLEHFGNFNTGMYLQFFLFHKFHFRISYIIYNIKSGNCLWPSVIMKNSNILYLKKWWFNPPYIWFLK